MSHVAHPLTPAARRAGRLVLLATLAVYLLTTGGSMATDVMSYEVTRSIVEDRSVAMSGKILNLDAHRGVDGRYYSPYGLAHPVYSVPFYVAGRLAEVQLGFGVGRSEAVRKAAFVMGSAVAAALTVWIAFLFAWRLSGHGRASVTVAFALAFGTLLWPYAKYGFNAPLAALTVLAGVYATWTGVRAKRDGMLIVAGACFGGALLVRPELALAAVVAGLWAAVESELDPRRVLRVFGLMAAPFAVAMAVMFAYNAARFGNIWDSGYLRDAGAAFNTGGGVWEGFAGLLVSPGRSFFLYSPIALAGIVALAGWFRRDRSTALLFSGVLITLFAFYASLLYWDADRSYGPRYLLPLLPFVVLPLVAWFAEGPRATRSEDPLGFTRARVLRFALAISVLIQIPGIAMDFTKAGPALGVSHPLLERRWNWRVAGLTTNTRAMVHFAPDNARYVLGIANPPPVRPPEGRDAGFSEQFGYSFDFWWLYLFYFGKFSRLTMIAVGGGLAGVAALAIRGIRTAPS
jgi:hypothetical protein